MCPHISSNAPHNRGSAQPGNVLDLGKLSAHHRTRLQEGDPEPRLAEAQRAHQRSPALVQVLGAADARHFRWLPKGRDISHEPNLAGLRSMQQRQKLRYPPNLWIFMSDLAPIAIQRHE